MAKVSGDHMMQDSIWSLPESVSLVWQVWDPDEVIVFNRASGQTHLLDAFSAAVLREIAERPRSMSALSEDLAERLGLDDSAVEARSRIVCESFARLGLAETS
jgi:PqqD family protein of HPr-rel-A system